METILQTICAGGHTIAITENDDRPNPPIPDVKIPISLTTAQRIEQARFYATINAERTRHYLATASPKNPASRKARYYADRCAFWLRELHELITSQHAHVEYITAQRVIDDTLFTRQSWNVHDLIRYWLAQTDSSISI